MEATATAGQQEEIPIAERTNMVFLGTLVCNGHGRALVVGTGMRSEFGRTFAEMRDMEHRRTPLQAKMDTLAKQVGSRVWCMGWVCVFVCIYVYI